MKPMMNPVAEYETEGNSFRGYREGEFGNIAEFEDMLNMTGDSWPVMRVRDERRLIRTTSGNTVIFAHEHLGWIDGNKLYYNGAYVGELSAQTKPRRTVNLGAYVVIFPDKAALNTQTLEVTQLQSWFICRDAVTYTACDMDGVSMDYRTAVYVKMEYTEIGEAFRLNDVVEIEGSQVLAGAYQIYGIGTNWIVVQATMDQQTVTASGGLVSRTCPDMDYVTELGNRIWGCSSENHEIYACKLGDPTNWRNYQGLANDAYAVTVGSPEEFTGCASFGGYALFFKRNEILKLFGNRPSNYQLSTTKARGIAPGCWRSAVVCNETLYYMTEDGMAAYEGGLPMSCSAAWGDRKYTEGVAGAWQGKVYLCAKRGNDGWRVLVYDTERGMWWLEDDARFDMFARAGGNLYGLGGFGIWKLRGTDETAGPTGKAEEITASLKTPSLIGTGVGTVAYHADWAIWQYEVTAGEWIWCAGDGYMWFQSTSILFEGVHNDYLIGQTFLSSGGRYVKVPEGATWLQISKKALPGGAEAYHAYTLEDENAADEGPLPWGFMTGKLDMGMLERKRVKKVAVRVRVDEGTANICAEYDSKDTKELARIRVKRNVKSFELPLVPYRCDHFRIGIVGTGKAEILNINYRIERGSGKRGL